MAWVVSLLCIRFMSSLLSNRYCERISAHPDREGKRLYLIEHHNHICFCFDPVSWTMLAKIDSVYGFDEERDRICCYDYDKGLYFRRVPTLEEHVSAGGFFIGQSLIAEPEQAP